TIGSHTKNHAILPNETAASLRDELAGSRRELSRRTGTDIVHFAYPGGHFNSSAVREVASSGYRFAYTGCTHREIAFPLLTIPRVVLWENSSLDSGRAFSGSVLNCQVHRSFDLVTGCRQRHAEG